MTDTCTNITAGSACATASGELDNNLHCIKDNVIYISDSSTPRCTAINASNAVVSVFVKDDAGYTAGTLGTTASGIIYDCASGGTCQQIVSQYYYSTGLYKCDDTGNCTLQSSAAGTYLVGEGSDDGNGNLVYSAYTCTSVSACTAVSSSGGIFIDAGTAGNIINCSNATTCTSSPGSTVSGIGYIDASDTNSKKIITCSEGACTSTDKSGTPNKYFIDGSDQSKIITCGSSCSSGNANVNDSNAYLNTGTPTTVIQCTTTVSNGATTTECASTEAANDDHPIVNYIDASTPANIITCKKETTGVTCSTSAQGKAKGTGYGYIDYMIPGNVILCDTSCTSDSAISTTAISDTISVKSVGFIDATDTDEKTVIACTNWGTASAVNITCSTKEVTEADGRAYLDGASTYTATDGFAKILSFDGTSVTQVTTPETTGDGYIYIDGTDESNKRIIKCSAATKCLSDNNDSSEADESNNIPAVNAFYLDGTNNKNYILCKPSDGCESYQGTDEDYELDKYFTESINPGKIIKCSAQNGGCSQDNAVAETTGYFVDGYTNGILSCGDASTEICIPLTDINVEDLTGYIYFDTTTIIHCNATVTTTSSKRDTATASQTTTVTSTVCSALPTNESTTDDNYYIDGTDSSKIITCVKGGTACTSATATGTAKSMAYNNPSDSRIIQCTSETVNGNASITCESKEGASETIPKIHYIEAVTTTDIITCLYDKTSKVTTCDKEAAVTTAGIGYMDYVNKGYIIKCQATPCVSEESPAVAKTDSLPSQNASYIDGYDTTSSTIITCVNSGDATTSNITCTSKSYVTLPDGHALLDGTSFTSPNFTKLLTYDTATNITSTAPANLLTDGFIYIDASDETLENVISCSTGPIFKTEKNLSTEGVNAFYINGLNTTNIVTCVNGDGCVSDVGSTVSGHAYRNSVDLKKVIICDTACAATTGYDTGTAKTDSYINADDVSQIIHCPEATKDCILVDSKASATKSSYFPRYNDESANLLNCTYYSNTNTTCELTTTTADHKNTVYLNSLYGNEELTNAKPLIQCDNNNKCKPSDPTFAAENVKPLYYPNSDPVNIKDDLIVCTKKADDEVQCSVSKGNEKDVYLNANYEETNYKKQVIICKNDGCLEYATNSTSSDFRYYVNAGSVFKKSLNDTLIECKDICEVLTTVKDGEIYINEYDTSQTIQCYEDKGCTTVKSQATDKKNEIFLNSSNLNKSEGTEPAGNEPLKNDLIKCVYEEGNITCSAKDGQADEVYVNSHNTTEIIYCKSDGCTTKASEALTTQPEYYINADPTDEEKLDGDLIKCKNTGTKITCEVTKGGDGDVYLNANVENDSNNKPLIICTKENGCLTDTSKATSAESLPAYYVNSGSVLTAKLNDTLIECNFGTATADCDIKQAVANDVYRNYGNNTETHQLIKCTTNGCKVAISSATEKSNEYYLNAGDKDEKALDYDIIECSNDGESVECVELQETGEGVYINSNYSEHGDSNQLILCSSDNGCEGIKTAAKGNEYYVNAEANDLNNSIIFCSNKKCEKQTPIDIPTYYVGTTQEGEVNGLIECTKSEVVADTTTATTTTTAAAASRRKRATEEKCKLKSAFTSNGYFLNAGYNKSVNQTIICDSTEGCETQNVDLGYYVNAGDDTKPIIKCEKEGSECYSEESDSCPQTSDAVAGNYCYEEGLLKFFPEGNSTAIAASKSDDIYTFATIPSGGFPGIKSETGALFKISRYFINRFYQSGIVMIDKNGKLVDNLSSADQSEISLYDCNDSTKTCTLRPGCTSNTYMYDSENKKAVFCNSGKLEYAEFTGYVVDGYRMVGTNHPYIIECQNNGNNCKSIKPKVSSYYENSGYDSSSNSLIECYNNNCVTKTADVGYYVGHEGEGIIQCTSSTSCNYSKSKSKVKYVNAGYNKSSSAIISCAKNSCSAVKAEIGYYLTYINTLLIYCSSPFNCVEFTPTVNYFENADSTESSSTIINCDQNSQVVTCALEATGNGFYMSSSPNELILCKSGNKCRTVKVKNGIFRSAVKAPSTKGYRRSDDDDVELSEDGNSVTIPRDSDDSYDIIRCVQEKCSALSPSEVAAIPICEFNNNKCYITLEYAMTKSATTSISAGNVCTNADRSIFYFATDTIVVKPNVISGVTATYVYTTTNSNCLEVNDSYSDMYFTVGSNIYLLDQGSVLQFYEQGYYFINTAKNSIVSGNDIDSYNDENVKLYKCNGSSCSIMDKPDSLTYYADVNKRIIRYNVNSDSYSFAYDKDITCIFANNKCTPNADLKNQEFCITYKGELALATADIKNRETGECYKASTISSNIYGYSQYLYSMNVYSAQMIDETGYYIISLSTNTTVVSKNYKTKNNNLVIYGCQLSSCKVIEPEEDTYYYDSNAKTILRYKDGVWKTPDTSGYAYISIDPSNTYIYRFTKNLEEVKINAMANYGYYYTVDGEMYHCDRDEDGDCSPIDNTGYYFTNAGEVYYCVHDSEEIEPTECTKQACVSGQYYYIEDAYYRCESSSTLVPVMSRFCSYNDNVIVNFPIALTEEYPEKIKQAVEGIEKNNNSTAIVSRRGKNYLESVSGIFTNCTYNVEETKSTFDLVCVNNFVTVDEETDDIKICSMEQLGYVECIEDEENPEKCNVSGGYARFTLSILSIIVVTLISTLLL